MFQRPFEATSQDILGISKTAYATKLEAVSKCAEESISYTFAKDQKRVAPPESCLKKTTKFGINLIAGR